jgi:hypothetical protein
MLAKIQHKLNIKKDTKVSQVQQTKIQQQYDPR